MKTFRDNKRRVWTLEVNVAAIKRVRGLCKVDLNSIVEVDAENRPTAHLHEQLSSDPVLLVDVLYAICKPEADKLGVSDEDFGESMAGDAIEQATETDIAPFPPAASASSIFMTLMRLSLSKRLTSMVAPIETVAANCMVLAPVATSMISSIIGASR